MVADDLAREADEDRRPHRAPWTLRRVSAGRGGGAARPVRRHPTSDRLLARATGGGLTIVNHGAAGAGGNHAPKVGKAHRQSPSSLGERPRITHACPFSRLRPDI